MNAKLTTREFSEVVYAAESEAAQHTSQPVRAYQLTLAGFEGKTMVVLSDHKAQVWAATGIATLEGVQYDLLTIKAVES